MKGVKKHNLPEKNCATCGHPFVWRKKWEGVWDEVKYCSDRCRMKKPGLPESNSAAKTSRDVVNPATHETSREA
ncbi:MAG: hypothetical protein RL088_2124 [Verrucomicrobiota bacterium]|jgi:hypothetical protein